MQSCDIENKNYIYVTMIINKDKILNISKFHKKNWKLGGESSNLRSKGKRIFSLNFFKAIIAVSVCLPLSGAVGVDVGNKWRGWQRFRGEHSSLQLQAKPHDAVAKQRHLGGFRVDYLTGQTHSAGRQGHWQKQRLFYFLVSFSSRPVTAPQSCPCFLSYIRC